MKTPLLLETQGVLQRDPVRETPPVAGRRKNFEIGIIEDGGVYAAAAGRRPVVNITIEIRYSHGVPALGDQPRDVIRQSLSSGVSRPFVEPFYLSGSYDSIRNPARPKWAC